MATTGMLYTTNLIIVVSLYTSQSNVFNVFLDIVRQPPSGLLTFPDAHFLQGFADHSKCAPKSLSISGFPHRVSASPSAIIDTGCRGKLSTPSRAHFCSISNHRSSASSCCAR